MTNGNEDLRKNYDKLSKYYDFISINAESKLQDLALKMLNIQPDANVLEIGCGTGSALIKIANYIKKDGSITGIDLSEKMINQVNKKSRKMKIENEIKLYQGDAVKIMQNELKQNIYDLIYISFVLEIMDNEKIDQLLRIIKKQIHPDGKIGIISILQTEDQNIVFRIYKKLNKIIPNIIDCKPIDLFSILGNHKFMIDEYKIVALYGIPVLICICHL